MCTKTSNKPNKIWLQWLNQTQIQSWNVYKISNKPNKIWLKWLNLRISKKGLNWSKISK